MLKGNKDKFTVSGKIQIHKPYCNEAKPTEEQAKGTDEPYANATFYVKNVMNNDKKLETVLQFKTDSEGNYSFKIKKGKYMVIHEDKTLSLEEYIAKYNKTTDKFLTYIGDKEAKATFEHVDFSLDIEADKAFNYAYKTRCFSGLNPLLRYSGPTHTVKHHE